MTDDPLVDPRGLSRREVMSGMGMGIGMGAGMAAGLLGLPAHAAAATASADRPDSARTGKLPTRDPAFNVKTIGRLQGDISGRTIYSYSAGQVFGLVPGEGPPLGDYGRKLYDTEGVSVRMSRVRADGAVEDRSRNWMFYKDPASGAYLSEFRNPYTGDTVAVPTFRGGIGGGVMTVNGPQVSANFTMESTVFGKPLLLDWRFIGDQVWIYRHAFTRWKESSTGFQKTEMTLDCWACRVEDVANDALTMIPSVYSWTSQTEWQSWLKMRGKPGAMLWRNESVKLKSPDQLPREFVAMSDKMLPGKLTEPLTWA